MKRILPILLFVFVFIVVVLSLYAGTIATALSIQQQPAHALIQRFYHEGFNKKNFSIIDKIVSPSYRNQLPNPSEERGPEVVKKEIQKLHALYEKFEIDLEYVSQEDNWIIAAWRGRAKQKEGEWIKYHGAAFFRILNGKIEESWNMTAGMAVDPFEVAFNPDLYPSL